MWFFKNCISILSIAVLVSCDSDFFGARGRNGRHNHNRNHRNQGRRGRQNSDLDLPEPVQVKSKSNPINSRPCEIFLADFALSLVLEGALVDIIVTVIIRVKGEGVGKIAI